METVQLDYYRCYPHTAELLPIRLAALRGAIPIRSRLIDLGCNDGRVSQSLLHTGHAASSLGVDFSDIRLSAVDHFDFIAADLRNFDLSSLPKADVILCLNVLHHLCEHGIEFARDFISELSNHANSVICEMGSQTEVIDAPWQKIMASTWQNDNEMWSYLFSAYQWRRPLLAYKIRQGRRIMWKLSTTRKENQDFVLLNEMQGPKATMRCMRSADTEELYWAKSYPPDSDEPASAKIRRILHSLLSQAPYDCVLPYMSHPSYGDIYAYDTEIPFSPDITPTLAMKHLSGKNYKEYLAFSSQTVAELDNFPIDMLCDFRVAMTARGLTFFHFEPTQLALKIRADNTK